MARWLRRLAVVIPVLALVAYGGASWYVYDQLTHAEAKCAQVQNQGQPDEFEIEDVDTARYHTTDFETVTFPSRGDGSITIAATWLPSEVGEDAPAVIVVHGHNACRHHPDVLLAGGMLHRAGFSVLAIDLRDHGDSTVEDGRFAGGTDEHLDALGAFDWLAVRHVPPRKVGIMGFSLGAATATIAFGREPRIAALWEDSGFADISTAIRDELTRNCYPTWLETGGVIVGRLFVGDDLTAYSPLAEIGHADGRPVFITHGEKDSRLSVRYAFVLADAVRDEGETPNVWIVPGLDHTQAITHVPAEYEPRLINFFTAALGR